MRIERVVLTNYRQFGQAEIEFEGASGNDLHIFVGRNGTGKTNILNAVNWCLYGDEPHLSKDSSRLPLLNLRAIEQAQDGEIKQVKVAVWTRTEDGGRLVFERSVDFRLQSNDITPHRQNTWFEVRATDSKGNTKVLNDPESSVERFVPKRIREFFFFDGERLDNYFREATGQRIRHAVSEISQIDLLERVESKLDRTLKDLEKEAGKHSPEIENARKELEQAEGRLRDTQEQIQACSEQIRISKEEIRKLVENLRGVPDIEALEDEREALNGEKSRKESFRNQKIAQKQNLLFDYGKILMLWLSIKRSIQIIDDKRAKNEIPPTVDKGLLQNILREGICTVCGKELDDESQQKVEALLKEIELSSDVAHLLSQMEVPLRHYWERLARFESEVSSVSREIGIFEEDLARIEERLGEIDREITGYDVERIKEWHRQRSNWESVYDSSREKLGVLKGEKERLDESIERLREQLQTELGKEEKVHQLKKQIDFCSRALAVLVSTRETMMSETRKRIEEETKRLFFELIWKKETFQDLQTDEDYNINLMHSMGYECLGSVSAAERELLALSFTLALHKVSGFNSPVLIDTPVARVSDLHRENFGKVFSEVAANKQIILLFTPAEYSEEICACLDSVTCTRRNLQPSLDEKVTEVEVV